MLRDMRGTTFEARGVVAAYVRMSTNNQRYSISNQLSVIEAFCEARGLSLGRVYSDAGKSGLTLGGRSGLTDLVHDAQAGALPFVAVIVLDVSRWGRFQNIDEGAYYEHILRRAGVEVIYCGETFEFETGPAATILKAVKRAMAAEHSRELSRRVSSGQRRVATMGFRCGGAAGYGYRRAFIDEAGRVVHSAEANEWKAVQRARTTLQPGPPAEVAAVRRIFELYVDHQQSVAEITRKMVGEEWPTPQTGQWTDDQVGLILSNEKYAGTLVFGRTSKRLRTRVAKLDPADWVTIADAHPALVSPALFAAAQARRAEGGVKHTRASIIRGIRSLFRRHGTVTRSLIVASPSLPSPTVIRAIFGSITQAYVASGLPERPPRSRRAKPSEVRHASA